MSEPAAAFEAAAVEAARRGGDVLRRRFRTEVASRVEVKGLHDFVTEVDREAEAAILDYLGARFPDHVVMSEEASPEAARAEHRWVVDPLDGTTNFYHGVPTFAVSIALEDARGVLAGAVYDAVHDEMFHAHRGGGARLNGEPIRCSRPEGSGKALIATGFPFRELGRLERYMVAFEAVVRSTAGLRRAGAAAIDLAYSACGRYDGFFEVGLSRWDMAAGVLLVQEAGGVVTDVLGGPGFLDSGDVVAAGREVQAMLLAITREAFGPGGRA
jgi:myo-inositol-1(or 4)-monophosphatase